MLVVSQFLWILAQFIHFWQEINQKNHVRPSHFLTTNHFSELARFCKKKSHVFANLHVFWKLVVFQSYHLRPTLFYKMKLRPYEYPLRLCLTMWFEQLNDVRESCMNFIHRSAPQGPAKWCFACGLICHLRSDLCVVFVVQFQVV